MRALGNMHTNAMLDGIRSLLQRFIGPAVAAAVGLWACQARSDKAEPSARRDQGEKHARIAAKAQGRRKVGPRPSAPRPASSAPTAPLLSTGVLHFDVGKPGTLPSFLSARTGRWALAVDGSAKSGRGVISQLGVGADSSFNLLLVKSSWHRNLNLSVWMRAVKGKVDQGGGLVWRAIDEKNYYVARYNPLEDNLRLYYVKRGRRRMLVGTPLRLDHRAWHQLSVTMTGDRILVHMDGKQRLDHRDRTFSAEGMVGLWTKADARTYFDDLWVSHTFGKGGESE